MKPKTLSSTLLLLSLLVSGAAFAGSTGTAATSPATQTKPAATKPAAAKPAASTHHRFHRRKSASSSTPSKTSGQKKGSGY
jgi:hypothetical protein